MKYIIEGVCSYMHILPYAYKKPVHDIYAYGEGRLYLYAYTKSAPLTSVAVKDDVVHEYCRGRMGGDRQIDRHMPLGQGHPAPAHTEIHPSQGHGS